MIANELFTKDFELNVQYLLDRKFSSLPVCDSINLMEVEWFIEAVKKNFNNFNYFYCYIPNYKSKKIEKIKINISNKSFIEINVDYTYCNLIITNPLFDFIYFKDISNRYFIISGPREFVNDSYKCSKETAKEMYFEWSNNNIFTLNEQFFLKNIWEKYFLV